MAGKLARPTTQGETPKERLEAFKKAYGCFFWKPYPWQYRLLEAVREKNTIAAISSNKIGKCLTYQTLIDTPNGEITVGQLFEIGEPFDVYAWDGTQKVVAKALPPFKKEGLHKCYRVTMSDGRWFEGADHHKILTASGEYISLDTLYGAFREYLADFGIHGSEFYYVPDVLQEKVCVDHCLPGSLQIPVRSTSEFSPSVQPLDDPRLSEIRSDYRGGCSEDCRRYDGLLLKVEGIDQAFLPLQDDAPRHNGRESGEDGQACICKDTCRPIAFPLSREGSLRHPVGLSVGSLSRTACTNDSTLMCERQECQQLSTTEASGSRQVPSTAVLCQHTSPLAYNPPLLVDGNYIISIDIINVNSVYDFEVEKYHNYFAAGIVHHNTACVINILISWLLGYEPWTQGYTGPDAVIECGQSYRSSSLGIKPPVNLILTGEDWKLHCGRVLVPELKKWAPTGWYQTKKNEQGVEYYWEWNNKSTLTIMSYSQEDDLFESWRAQGVVMDEPPPKSKYSAMSRGLLLDCGKTLLSLTPIKEAWILDEIVLSGRRDIGVVDGMNITDNPDLYNSDLKMLGCMGLDDAQKQAFFDLLLYEDKPKQVPVTDRGFGAEKYLEKTVTDVVLLDEYIGKLKILKFIKDIEPSDVPPRVFGQFKALVGRVLKEFDDNLHIVKPFEVPANWPVTVMIDFHLSTPQAVSYWAVNRQDVKFCIAETWKNISADGIADDIIRKVRGYGWQITDAFIDPLSKGDTAYMRNALGTDVRSTYNILEERLSEVGITLHVASKDKDSGIKNIQGWLKGPNGTPTVFIFDTCERHLYEVKRWVFDDDGKPSKDCSDHFCENWYRYSLTGAKFEDHVINPLPDHSYSGVSGWMGA